MTVPAILFSADGFFHFAGGPEPPTKAERQRNASPPKRDSYLNIGPIALSWRMNGNRTRAHGVYRCMGHVAATACLLAMVFASQGSTSLPWIFPGDFRDRLRISGLVVSGTVENTSPLGVQIVDGTELAGSVARIRVDRVFQGSSSEDLEFTWFRYHATTKGGIVYSGPPFADFRSHKRYLIFLKKEKSGWVVAMPLYALEIELAPTPPSNALRDVSGAPAEQRYKALAEELETAALLAPTPQPGLTGEAATYFPSVFDLLGGCAEPFYRRFLSSPSPELRGASLRWLSLIRSRRMPCSTTINPTLH
jgi:hypothetical protein